MDQLEPERNSNTRPNATKFNIRNIAIGLIAFAIIGTTIGIVAQSTSSSSVASSADALQQLQQRARPLLKRKVTNVRLPTTLQPLQYKLNIIPYLDPARNFAIEGTSTIDLLCKEPTRNITVHIKRITIIETEVQVAQLEEGEEGNSNGIPRNVSIPIVSHQYDADRDFYIVVLQEDLIPGLKYRIYIPYIGELSDELVGFYRSSYVDKATNETRWLAITQFSPTDARRAFPSLDEPALKAVFEISLGREEHMTSISNMNQISSEPIEGKPGWVWDHYNKTFLMSTYLIGLCVTDFIPNESNSSLSTPKFQIWSRKDAINQTEYAADVGPRMLSYFEEYFNVEFPLPKQDIIAVPDMRFSAMENWGLITFRELFILYDPKYSSDGAKRRIIEIVGHELAHQWFGNLVTPSWWNELWLKEGFASYVEYIGANHVEPEWRILDIFLVNDFQNVLKMDALNISHPIQVPVDNPDEINQVFDAISYSKGCSIIRMMDHFLTETTFKHGITNYLNKWKFNSTTQTYLWESLTEQAHLDGTLPENLTVGEIMDTWTLQKGFPVVKAALNATTGNVTLTKEKFHILKNDTSPDEEYKWWVPISYASSIFNSNFSKTQPEFWIPKEIDSVELQINIDVTSWYILNVQSTGYYRVNYDHENWRQIIRQLYGDHAVIHVTNRAQIIDDILNIARIESDLYAIAFNLTNYLRNDIDYLPWKSYVGNLGYLYNVLLNTTAIGPFKKYLQEQLKSEYERLGFNESDSETVLEKSHRIDILEWACRVNLSDCVLKANEMFTEWMNETNPAESNNIPVNLRGTIYCTAVSNGGEAEWNFAWEQYSLANVASEKDIILKALTCSSQEEVLNRYLNWSITDGSGVRKQDSRAVMQNIATNDIGTKLVFSFLQNEWTRIKEYFGGSAFSIDKIINEGIAPKLTTENDLNELLTFKADHDGDFGFGARAVEEAIEITKYNIQWMRESYDIVSDLLNDFNRL